MTGAEIRTFLDSGPHRPLKEAMQDSDDIARFVRPVSAGLQEVGAIRRQEPEVTCVELLLIHSRKTWRGKLRRGLEKYMRGLERRLEGLDTSGDEVWTFTSHGNPVAIWLTTRNAFVANLIIRTGPEEFVAGVVPLAMQQGYTLDGSGFRHDDDLIKIFSETEILDSIGLPYVPPQERAVVGTEYWKGLGT